MTRRVLILLLLVLPVPARSDLTGTWMLEFKPDFSGHDQTVDCQFKQDHEKLAIDCGGQAMEGKIDGRIVTFEHKAGLKQELTATYKADLNENGTLMKGTWHLSAPENRDGRFEARKQ
jgi:hypothetical protein